MFFRALIKRIPSEKPVFHGFYSIWAFSATFSSILNSFSKSAWKITSNHVYSKLDEDLITEQESCECTRNQWFTTKFPVESPNNSEFELLRSPFDIRWIDHEVLRIKNICLTISDFVLISTDSQNRISVDIPSYQ